MLGQNKGGSGAPAPRGVVKQSQQDEQHAYTTHMDDVSRAEAARHDLLALGIDLDNDLINRLQQNLGANMTFAATSRAANVVRGRTKHGKVENIMYRNVSASPGPQLQLIRTNNNEAIAVDMQHVTAVIQELNNRDSPIEPQVRASILKMLVSLRILYSKNPDKFLRTMHGIISNRVNQPTITFELKELLQRYLDEATFAEAVLGMYSDAVDDSVSILFSLLATTDHPVPYIQESSTMMRKQNNNSNFTGAGGGGGGAAITSATAVGARSSVNGGGGGFGKAGRKKQYVDVWLFLSLLKAGAEEDRRSYTSKTSNLAHTVEFWNQKRAGNRKNEEKRPSSSSSSSSGNNASSDAIAAAMIRHTSKSTLQREACAGNKGGMLRPGLMAPDLASTDKVWADSEEVRQRMKERADTVAMLLGNKASRVSKGVENRGRGVYGVLAEDFIDKDRIPDALHSPIRPKACGKEDSSSDATANASTAAVVAVSALRQRLDAPKVGCQPRKKTYCSDVETWSDIALKAAAAKAAAAGNGGSMSVLQDEESVHRPPSARDTSNNSNSMVMKMMPKHFKHLPPAWTREGSAVAAALHPDIFDAQAGTGASASAGASGGSGGTGKENSNTLQQPQQGADATSCYEDDEAAPAPAPASVPAEPRLAASYDILRRQTYNKTTVADALGCTRSDNIGRGSSSATQHHPHPGAGDHKEQQAKQHVQSCAHGHTRSFNNSSTMSSLIFPASVQ